MSASQGFRLKLRAQPALKVELTGLVPSAFAGWTSSDLASHVVWHGNESVVLGDLFDITPLQSATPSFVLEGDLSRFDGIGRGMDGGCIRLDGNAGDYLGAQMRAGEIIVDADAGLLAACEMIGGRLEIWGNVGDHAAGSLPGSMDGMRGGVLVVHGNAGARFGDRMRRGTAVIHGDAGDFLASRMVAGTIAIAGRVGRHCAYGMRRGTLTFAGEAAAQPNPPANFVPTGHDIRVFWALLSRSLESHGGRFVGLGARAPRRVVGDLAVDGKGEWLLVD